MEPKYVIALAAVAVAFLIVFLAIYCADFIREVDDIVQQDDLPQEKEESYE